MPRPRLAEDTRDTILDAVDQLLERYGYRKMAIEDVARAAGIGKGTVYLFFPSKEELVLSSIDRIFARVSERLRTLAAAPLPAPERLRSILIERVLGRHEEAALHARAIDEIVAALRSTFFERRARYYAVEAEILTGVLREGQARREFGSADPEVTAEALILATNALLPSALSPRELDDRHWVAERIGRLAELLLRGLLVRGA